MTSIHVFILFFVIWAVGFLITIAHELGHAMLSHGKIEYIQIGIAFGFHVQIGKFKIYPLLPIAGGTKLTIEHPTKKRIVLFALAGIIAGFVASILVGITGFDMLSPEYVSQLLQSHKLRFLLTEILAGTANLQTIIATAFLISNILYGVQQLGNLLPIPGYDGHLILTTLRSN
jgi:hypothetical protein